MINTPRADDFEAWVEQLGDPIRGCRAYWHLVLSGAPALPEILLACDRCKDADCRPASEQVLAPAIRQTAPRSQRLARRS